MSSITAQTPVFRGGTDLVQLDVSVLDKHRQPVRGLTQAEFSILEDGKPQTVAAFAAVDLPDVVTTGAPWLRDVAPDVTSNEFDSKRIFVLVLDDATMPMDLWAVEATRKSAERVIDRMGPDDLATVIFTMDNRGAQDLTNDRAKLKKAVNTLSRLGNMPLASSGGSRVPSANAPACWVYTSSIGVVQRAIEYLAVVPQRRKALVYFSGGMSVDIGAQRVVGPLTPPDVASRENCGSQVVGAMTDAFRDAQRSNVNVYGMDPMGLRVDSHLGSPSGVVVEFLQTVSDNTGGHAIINTNDFEPGLTQMFRENSSYYLLGYQPTNVKADGTFRRLEVKVSRPDVDVRTRRNYVAPKPPPPLDAKAPAPSKAVLALSEILPKADVPMRIAVAPFAVAGKPPTVTMVIGLRQPLQSQRMTDDVELLVKAFTPEGDGRGSADQTVPIMVPPARRGSEFTRYEVLTQMALKPGRYQLRVAVHSGAFDKHGSIYADVEVPDFEKAPLSLSGVVLSTAPGLPIAPADALNEIIPAIPTAEREFLRVERVSAFLRVYQGGKAKLATVALSSRIVDAAGATVFEESGPVAPEQFGAARAADTRLPLPLTRLAPGDYLLSFEVTLDKTTIRRDVRFRVK